MKDQYCYDLLLLSIAHSAFIRVSNAKYVKNAQIDDIVLLPSTITPEIQLRGFKNDMTPPNEWLECWQHSALPSRKKEKKNKSHLKKNGRECVGTRFAQRWQYANQKIMSMRRFSDTPISENITSRIRQRANYYIMAWRQAAGGKILSEYILFTFNIYFVWSFRTVGVHCIAAIVPFSYVVVDCHLVFFFFPSRITTNCRVHRAIDDDFWRCQCFFLSFTFYRFSM